MNKTITVELKFKDNERIIYPVCDTAKLFTQLTNTKTLSESTIVLIKKLGYTIEVLSTLPKVL